VATRPSHIYASTSRRREFVRARRRRRAYNTVSTPLGLTLALLLSTTLGVVLERFV
jgi:hypothetical protein